MRDFTKYLFDGTEYGKGRLVLAVIKSYVSQHSQITYSDLVKVFDDSLQGSLGVVRKLTNNPDPARFYCNQADVIRLADCECAVCSQWGVSNIGKFLQCARALGFQICELPGNSPTRNTTPQKSANQKSNTHRNRKAYPLTPPSVGPDISIRGQYVFYDKRIPVQERVPDLAAALEEYYGEIREFAKGLFKDVFYKNEMDWSCHPIPVIISPDTPLKYYDIKNLDHYHAQQIKHLVGEKGKALSKQEILNVLLEKEFCDRTIGGYCSGGFDPSIIAADFWNPEYEDRYSHWAGGPYILIYFHNYTCDSLNEYHWTAINILAHEFIHHVHHCFIGNASVGQSFEADCVSESIADFSSFLYMLKHGSLQAKIAKGKFDMWRSRDGFGWPYSDSLRFCVIAGQEKFSDRYSDYDTPESIGKLREVFALSRTTSQAYQRLHQK